MDARQPVHAGGEAILFQTISEIRGEPLERKLCVPRGDVERLGATGWCGVYQSLLLDRWNLSGPLENVFDIPRSMFDSSQTPHQGVLHSTTPSATGAVPVHGRKR